VTRVNGPEQSARKGCLTCSQEFGGELTVCPHDGTHLTPLGNADLLGTVLDGRYEIQEVLAGGGMGLVYRARHRLMNRTVAIKVLHKHMVTSPDALKRFQLEAQAVSSLAMPNILTIFDFGISQQGQPYMVMDYLAGVSLADVLEAEHRLSVARSLNIFIHVCEAIEHAHEKNVIHRDLKPSNIMLINSGEEKDFVKIVDFGIAKLLGQTEGDLAELTRTGEVFGSPLYMSPEQCRGKPVDCRTDIYSLGSVIYRTITGKRLFEGDQVLDLFFKQVSQEPAPFSVACPEIYIPEQLENAIFKALQKEPSMRFQSMAAFKAALQQCQKNPSGIIQIDKAAATAATSEISIPRSKSLLPADPSEQIRAEAERPYQINLWKAFVIVGCLLGSAALLAFSFVLGTHEAIDEAQQKNKNAAIETKQEGKSTMDHKNALISPTVQPLDRDEFKEPGANANLVRTIPFDTSNSKIKKIARSKHNPTVNRQPQAGEGALVTTEQDTAPPIAPAINRNRFNGSTTSAFNSEAGSQRSYAPGANNKSTSNKSTVWKEIVKGEEQTAHHDLIKIKKVLHFLKKSLDN